MNEQDAKIMEELRLVKKKLKTQSKSGIISMFFQVYQAMNFYKDQTNILKKELDDLKAPKVNTELDSKEPEIKA